MRYNDADRLATLITRNWRNGLNPEIWCQHLENDYSNPDRAKAAITKLTRTKVHAPSIAEFHTEYLATSDPTQPAAPTCDYCDSTGWYHVEQPRFGIQYTYATPCLADDCRHATQARRNNDRINADRRTTGNPT